ncbi:MAG: TetR/AcrR family transcriptional regulator [Rhodospirillaceae bacterium]|nr:TetR/AcrR family transcriptional regulator [Rhodospirillaceae bacterium]
MTEIDDTSAREENSSRRRILDCAARLFRHKGYGATSLRDIAAESGMKAGSLYYHFASKDEIVIDILNIGVARVHDTVRSAIDALAKTATYADTIRAAIHAHLRALHEADDYTSANVRIFGQVPETVRDAHLAIRRAYEETWSKLLTAAFEAGELRPTMDPQLVLALLLRSLNASLEWFDPKKGPVERIAATFSELVLRGAVDEAPAVAKRRA